MLHKKHGILLVNLGTPDSPSPKDVKRYLTEFLLDPRVINQPYLFRQLLVRGIIIPRRYKESAKNYQAIWTEEGSPLKFYGRRVCKEIQAILGENYQVELAMRYQNPSIKEALDKMRPCESITLIPLFPQYASATTGSIIEEFFKHLCKWEIIPPIRSITHFYNHPSFIQAFCERAKMFDVSSYDHILFSFHGLPESHLKKADHQAHCLKTAQCCEILNHKNSSCYSAQCYQTAHLIADQLKLQQNTYTITFQSRLGKEPWIRPYTIERIRQFAKEGKKKLLVFCPAFVADCLETKSEIGQEYTENFIHWGGEKIDLVPSLNDHPLWINTLIDLIKNPLKQ